MRPVNHTSKELHRPIATAKQARQMLKIGVTYKSTDETLANLGCRLICIRATQVLMVHETGGRYRCIAPARLDSSLGVS